MPTRIAFGDGSLARLPELLPDPKARVIVMSGGGSVRANGTLDRVAESLGSNTLLYEGIPPNPTPDHVDRAVAACREGECGVVVGIGGGSVLDVAKCVAVLERHSGHTIDYLTRRLELAGPGLPCIAIPTTAGTGSEVTPWASVWDAVNYRKYSLDARSMFPLAAIVDPELTWSLPPAITAATGIDALTQAIESYWSKAAQTVSDMCALEAVRTIMSSLEGACHEGTPHWRTAMAHGSLMAGLAFSNTRTTICHSLSYPMTARYGVVHGQAVSITLPIFLQWNADALGEKLPALLAALGARTVEHAADRIRELMTDVGLATRFSGLGLSDDALDVIVAEGYYPERADNNPKAYSTDEVRSLLSGIL